MGEVAARYMAFKRKPQKQEPEGDQKARDRMEAEAAEHGASLHSHGRGGLPASVALGIFRRDQWHCHKCGGKSDLTLHHKADILASDYLRRLHKVAGRTDPRNLAVICHACHDDIHESARKQGISSD